MKALNVITVLCTENEFLNPEFNAQITTYPFQYVLRADGSIMKRFKAATQKWLTLKVDKIPNVVCPFVELGIEKGSIIPAEALAESHDFLPAGKVPVRMLSQIVAFFKAVMQYKMGDVLSSSSYKSSTGHNFEAMIFVIFNPATGYRLGIPTQRVSAASVSYDHDCYDLNNGDVIVVDIH